MEQRARYHDLVRTDVLPALPVQQVGRVLDFGGGVGATSALLRRTGRASHVTVADQVGGQLGEIDRVYRGDLENTDFVTGIGAEAGPFDTVLALDILEHLRDPWLTVRLLRDCLAPNGILIASIPNVNHHSLVLPLVLKGRFTLADSGILDRTHLRWFALHGAVELMSSPGLAVEEIRPNIVGVRENQLDRISRGALRRFVALQYVIRSRRVD